MFARQKHYLERGFTVIELFVVIVLLILLGTLVAVTYSGVQAKNRNAERQSAINTLQGQLEAYYAQNNQYPTLAHLNDASWRSANMKKLASDTLRDPRWSASVTACSKQGTAVLNNGPAANCYAYQVTTVEGGACDDANLCAHYTLTTTLEGGGTYVKSSLN